MIDDRDVTEISGVGETRAAALAEAGFEMVHDVRAADAAALTDAHGIGEKRADALISAVEEMRVPDDASSASTSGPADGAANADANERDRATVEFSPDTDADTDTADREHEHGASHAEDVGDESGRILNRVKGTLARTFAHPAAGKPQPDLTDIGTVGEKKAAALRAAGYGTVAEVYTAAPNALAEVEGIDETQADYLQSGAEQALDASEPSIPTSVDASEQSGREGGESAAHTDEDPQSESPADAEAETKSESETTPLVTDGEQNESSREDTTDDESGRKSRGNRGVEAVKTAARAVVNPASIVQGNRATVDEAASAPASDDGQQLSEDAIAEIAGTAGVSPSKARELIQSATENENIGLIADASAASASVTTENSDLENTYAADLIAPASLRLSPSSAQTSAVHTKVIYVEGYPEFAKTKMFERLFAESDHVDVDISIHVSSHERLDAIGHVRDAIEDLQVIVAQKDDESDVTIRDTVRRLKGHDDVYDDLSTGVDEAFDVGFYIILRGNNASDLEDAAETIETKLKTKRLTVKPADYAQQDGLVAGSPIGADRLDRTDTMMGGAVGAMYPFSSTSLIEPSGVLVGYHALTDSPVVMDCYERPNYNVVVAGELGAGKSFGEKLRLLRMLARDPETIVIIIDPRGEFEDLVETLNGNRIAVSGSNPINPLEIEAIPEHVRTEIDSPDYNPFQQGRSSAMDTFDSYFSMTSAAGESSYTTERRTVLGFALDVTYAMFGFTTDPATHTNPSPVIPDVRSVFGAIDRNPAPFIRLSNAGLRVTPDVVDELPGIDPENRRVTAANSPASALVTVLPDMTASHAEKLAAAGIDTLGELVEADPETVARTADVRLSEADEWREQAVSTDEYASATATGPTQTATDGGAETPDESPAWMDEGFEVTEGETDDWRSHARGLKIALQPFRPGGTLGHLGQPTDIDITDSNVTYLDFQASDTETEMSLMTKVLFNAIYERAKTTDKRVVLPIDEAWRLIKNSESLTWLEQGTRFSRHHDLSIQFITQTLDEFYEREDAKFIIDNSATKILHNLDGGLSDEQADNLDLTDREASYVNNATLGETGAGYSQALLLVKEEGKYPLRVEALPEEIPLIDPDAASDAGGRYS